MLAKRTLNRFSLLFSSFKGPSARPFRSSLFDEFTTAHSRRFSSTFFESAPIIQSEPDYSEDPGYIPWSPLDCGQCHFATGTIMPDYHANRIQNDWHWGGDWNPNHGTASARLIRLNRSTGLPSKTLQRDCLVKGRATVKSDPNGEPDSKNQRWHKYRINVKCQIIPDSCLHCRYPHRKMFRSV